MKRVKRVAILTFAGVLLFSMGVIASGILEWTGDDNLSNTEADVSEYVEKVNSYTDKAEQAIKSLKAQIESLKETKESLDQQLADQSGQNETLQNKIKELDSQIDELTNSLKETTDLLQNANTVIGELTTENESLKSQMGNNSSEIERLSTELIEANDSALKHERDIQTILEGGSESLDESIFENIDENESVGTNLINLNKAEFETDNAIYDVSENSISARSSSGDAAWVCTTSLKVTKGKKYHISGTSSEINARADIYYDNNKSFSFPGTSSKGELDTTFVAPRGFIRIVIKNTSSTGSNYTGSASIKNLSLVEVEE